MASENQYGFFRDILLNEGALVVTGITGGGGSGTSGTSGTSGAAGTSGTNGSNGTSGTDGTSGSSGVSGVSTSKTGSHFNWELSPYISYSLALTATDGYRNLEGGAIWAFPFTPGRDITISAVTIDTVTTSATGEIKLLAYDTDYEYSAPNNLLFESPSIVLTAVTGTTLVMRQYNVEYTFSAGTTYWLGLAANSTGTVSVRSIPNGSSFTFGVPNVTGSPWRYNLVRSTQFTYPTIPSTWVWQSSVDPGYNWAANYEIRFKVKG